MRPLDVPGFARADDHIHQVGTVGPELTVVVPTFNEQANVRALVAALELALSGIRWEVIFVDDDSPDGTAEEVRALATVDARVRCLQRIGRRGLSTAVIEGMLASSAPYLAVIDGDLQHDPSILPQMFNELRHGQLDVIVASRYTSHGSVGDWDKSRATMSTVATRMAKLVVSSELTDPMSGFFMLTRPAFEGAVRGLSGYGFKILLDLFASTPTVFRFKEIPFVFRRRFAGESKLDQLVAWEYLLLLLDKSVGRYVPVRFLLFSGIGAFGIAVHLAVLRIALMMLGFSAAQGMAALAAMTNNFFLNNWLTYRDRRLRGWRAVTGLLSFWAVCSVGLVANVGVATLAFRQEYEWWVSGLAGAAISAVWNYAASAVVTWSSK